MAQATKPQSPSSPSSSSSSSSSSPPSSIIPTTMRVIAIARFYTIVFDFLTPFVQRQANLVSLSFNYYFRLIII